MLAGSRRKLLEPPEHKSLKKMNSKLSKKKRMENENKADSDNYDQLPNEDEHILDRRKSGRTKRKHTKISTDSQTLSQTDSFIESKDANSETKTKNKKVKKNRKSKKKDLQGRKIEEMLSGVPTEIIDEIPSVSEDHSGGMKKLSLESQSVSAIGTLIESKEANSKRTHKTKKVNKNAKTIKDFQGKKLEKSASEANEDMVDELSSIDDDSSRGMKKWLSEYKQRRPGLKILQQRIDEFITTHEEKQEQERKDREAHVAEGGWTVVVHHKGRKKTTDTESGITVGSVAQAAVMDKMAKKKSKEVPVDFYRFQKREAKRNEVMMLQSKFEQDKKRIQQLRAARKFRPY